MVTGVLPALRTLYPTKCKAGSRAPHDNFQTMRAMALLRRVGRTRWQHTQEYTKVVLYWFQAASFPLAAAGTARCKCYGSAMVSNAHATRTHVNNHPAQVRWQQVWYIIAETRHSSKHNFVKYIIEIVWRRHNWYTFPTPRLERRVIWRCASLISDQSGKTIWQKVQSILSSRRSTFYLGHSRIYFVRQMKKTRTAVQKCCGTTQSHTVIKMPAEDVYLEVRCRTVWVLVIFRLQPLPLLFVVQEKVSRVLRKRAAKKKRRMRKGKNNKKNTHCPRRRRETIWILCDFTVCVAFYQPCICARNMLRW